MVRVDGRRLGRVGARRSGRTARASRGLLGATRDDAVVPKTSAGAGLRAVLSSFDAPPRVVATGGEFDSLDLILREWARRGRARAAQRAAASAATGRARRPRAAASRQRGPARRDRAGRRPRRRLRGAVPDRPARRRPARHRRARARGRREGPRRRLPLAGRDAGRRRRARRGLRRRRRLQVPARRSRRLLPLRRPALARRRPAHARHRLVRQARALRLPAARPAAVRARRRRLARVDAAGARAPIQARAGQRSRSRSAPRALRVDSLARQARSSTRSPRAASSRSAAREDRGAFVVVPFPDAPADAVAARVAEALAARGIVTDARGALPAPRPRRPDDRRTSSSARPTRSPSCGRAGAMTGAGAFVARNARCPCGSGRRSKHAAAAAIPVLVERMRAAFARPARRPCGSRPARLRERARRAARTCPTRCTCWARSTCAMATVDAAVRRLARRRARASATPGRRCAQSLGAALAVAPARSTPLRATDARWRAAHRSRAIAACPPRGERISVVCPSHNHAAFVEAALASALAQTRAGRRDRRHRRRIDRRVGGAHRGGRRARGAAASAASRASARRGRHAQRGDRARDGDWIAIVNSDDRFAPHRLATMEAASPRRRRLGASRASSSSTRDGAILPPGASAMADAHRAAASTRIGACDSVGFAFVGGNRRSAPARCSFARAVRSRGRLSPTCATTTTGTSACARAGSPSRSFVARAARTTTGSTAPTRSSSRARARRRRRDAMLRALVRRATQRDPASADPFAPLPARLGTAVLAARDRGRPRGPAAARRRSSGSRTEPREEARRDRRRSTRRGRASVVVALNPHDHDLGADLRRAGRRSAAPATSR